MNESGKYSPAANVYANTIGTYVGVACGRVEKRSDYLARSRGRSRWIEVGEATHDLRPIAMLARKRAANENTAWDDLLRDTPYGLSERSHPLSKSKIERLLFSLSFSTNLKRMTKISRWMIFNITVCHIQKSTIIPKRVNILFFNTISCN